MADHFPSLPIPGLAPVGHVEMRVKQSKSCFTRHVLAAPHYLLTGGRSSTAVSSASASTGVLATTADLCSTYTAATAAAKSMVKMVTVASASAMLLVCHTMPTASVTAVLVLPTT